MKNRTVFYKLGMVMALAVTFQACKPKLGITGNNEVVSKPYSLYIGTDRGAIYNTNDGYAYKIDNYNGADGASIISFGTSGDNLLFVKYNKKSNATDVHVVEYDFGPNSNPAPIFNSHQFANGATMFLDWPKYHRIYFAGDLNTSGGITMCYSDSNGQARTPWTPEGAYPRPTDPDAFSLTFRVSSFTMLASGRVIAYSDVDHRIFWCDDPVNSKWKENGTSLPQNRHFFLSHIANTVLAIADTSDVYYSTDDGKTWNQYTGIPSGTHILSACAPGDQCILVGTEGRGIYRLRLGRTTFEPVTAGVPANATVYALADKYDYYKNDKTVRSVFAGTGNGLYRSPDNGENWNLTGREDEAITALH